MGLRDIFIYTLKLKRKLEMEAAEKKLLRTHHGKQSKTKQTNKQ